MMGVLTSVFFVLCLWSISPANTAKPTAAVFGGGPAGLTAAMELAEAGFEVDLYEREKRFGGKMIGYVTKRKLATEHSIRLYSWRYYALGDVLERVGLQPPTVSNPQSPTWRKINPHIIGTQKGLVEGTPANVVGKLVELGVSPPELSYFIFQIAAYGNLDFVSKNSFYKLSFSDFIDGFAFDQWVLHSNCTPNTVSATEYCKASHTTAFHDFLASMLGIFTAAKPTLPAPVGMYIFQGVFRTSLPPPTEMCVPFYKYIPGGHVASGPTSLKIVDPWTKYLKSIGVRLHSDTSLVKFDIDEAGNKINSAKIKIDHKKRNIVRDAFVMALPVDDAEDTLPGVTKGRTASTFWSFSFQFFLPCLNQEYLDFYYNKTRFTLLWDSPYYIAYFLQSPDDGAWEGADIELKKRYDYVLSVTISNVTDAGFNGKTFLESTREEALKETLREMLFPEKVECTRRRTGKNVQYDHSDMLRNVRNGLYLKDVTEKRFQRRKNRNYRTFSIGPLKHDGKRWLLTVPIFLASPEVNPIGMLTQYTNLFLAGEFVSSPLLNIPTMEHAAESGKLAAQAAVDLMGIKYKVPRVEELLSLVEANTVSEYDERINTNGIFTGKC